MYRRIMYGIGCLALMFGLTACYERVPEDLKPEDLKTPKIEKSEPLPLEDRTTSEKEKLLTQKMPPREFPYPGLEDYPDPFIDDGVPSSTYR
ncbi:MAG: hypothetical protein KAT43_02285 [Nanoarchaeota archaeon]|nr:hypothetical protein [Nanoarchaeota archaeon]